MNKQIQARTFDFTVDGISQKQIDVHLALYNGYVKNFNELLIDLDKHKSETRVFSDLTRRLAFEYNGIRLHELYFTNLKNNTNVGGKFKNLAINSFGSFDEWKSDFQRVTTMRGVGWGIVYYDRNAGMIINTFVADHEIGHLSTCEPLLVCDLWEHAFAVDFLPTERAKYLEVFWNNINWEAVEERI